jgi:hypothetical protein
MDTDTRAAETEARFRALLEGSDLPQPDVVEHLPGELLFLWHDRKLAVAVDLTDDEETA